MELEVCGPRAPNLGTVDDISGHAILQFCSTADICSLGVSNRLWSRVQNSEKAWATHCRNRLIAERCSLINGSNDEKVIWKKLDSLKADLCVPSFKTLNVLLGIFPEPVIGLYHLTSTKIDEDFRGAIFSVNSAADGVLSVSSIFPGEARTVAQIQLGSDDIAIQVPSSLHFNSRKGGSLGFSFTYVDTEDPAIYLKRQFARVVEHPPALVPPIEGAACAQQPLALLSGLWTGLYASHGMEVLSLSTVSAPPADAVCFHHDCGCAADANTAAAVAAAAAAAAGSGAAADRPPPPPRCAPAAGEIVTPSGRRVGFPRLEGRKLVGDANVPANELSFAAAAAAEGLGGGGGGGGGGAAEEEAGRDGRGVLRFTDAGGGYTIGPLSELRPRVAAWLRGAGQINMVQGVWAPQWEDVDLLVLDGGRAFALLWADRGEGLRHMIEFSRFQPPEAPPPPLPSSPEGVGGC